MSDKLNYKSIAIQAGITALVFALVNRFMAPAKGLGMPEKLLLNLSMDRMAQFADVVTIANVNNYGFLKEQLGSIDPENTEIFKNGNRTSIGNCAFVAVHSKFPDMREKAALMIANYKKFAL